MLKNHSRGSGAEVPEAAEFRTWAAASTRWRPIATDQPPEQRRMGMHQVVFPGALRPIRSTMETQGSAAASGGNGATAVWDLRPVSKASPISHSAESFGNSHIR